MAIVCVTGASGLFASWLVKRLLEAGYHVRGTVRDPDNSSKTSFLWELDGAKERLQLFKADLTTEGVFDSIVEGCEGVFHTASTVFFTADDPEREIVQPAVLGTLNVLKSCKKSTTVKRVILTSSASAVAFAQGVTPETVMDESFWSSPDFCREHKLWYPLSKILAEQGAWEYAKENGIDLVSVIPSFIFGSFLPPEARTSVELLLGLMKGDASQFQAFHYIGVIHMDDVASAHILVYENQMAAGRYLCSAMNISNVELAQFIRSRYPEYHTPSYEPAVAKIHNGFSSQKLEALGLKFKGLGEMLDDSVESFKQKRLL